MLLFWRSPQNTENNQENADQNAINGDSNRQISVSSKDNCINTANDLLDKNFNELNIDQLQTLDQFIEQYYNGDLQSKVCKINSDHASNFLKSD